MKEVVIIGAGGNSRVIIDIINNMNRKREEIKILGILDDSQEKDSLEGYPVLGRIDETLKIQKNNKVSFINGIGDNTVRLKIAEKYPELNHMTVIDPSAIISANTEIGAGSVIMPGAIINTGTRIGKGTIINSGAIIEHDNKIGNFVHIASGTVTAGNVNIGDETMLGTGTKVIQGVKIGANTLIGAGTVVIGDIPDNCVAVGVPARIIKYK